MRQNKVAVLDDDRDLLFTLGHLLRASGFETAEACLREFVSGGWDLGGFLEAEDPWVVIYDLPYPYRDYWEFFRSLRDVGVFHGRCPVLTSTNPPEVKKFSGGETIHPLVQKPFSLDQMVKVVEDHCRNA